MFLPKVVEEYTYKMTPGMEEFMDRMNFKAAQLGMTSSTFYNPYGGEAFGFNTTTCMDLLRVGIYAYSDRYVMDVITNRYGADLHIYGEHERDARLDYDFQKDFDDAYDRVHPGETNPYIIYGGKGGGWGGGEHKVFAYLAYARVADKNVLIAVSNVSADRSVGRLYRKNAVIEVLDMCAKAFRGESVEGQRIQYADYAAATLLPTDTLSVLLKQRPIDLIFAQDPDAKFNPASITKMLMAVTATEIIESNQEMYMITQDDIANDSVYWAFPGDIESVQTGFYPILISSNGSNTMALARHCGEKILREKEKFGLLK